MSYIKQKDGSGDTYTLKAAQDGADVDIQLDAAAGTDSEVKLKAGTNITLTEAADTVTIDSAGAGGSIGVNQVAFGDPLNAGDIKGSDNFTFVDETPGLGPNVLITGDTPIFELQDDTSATNFLTRLQQSGASLYFIHKDSVGTNLEYIRLSPGTIILNDDAENIDVRIEGVSAQSLLRTNAAQDNVGVGTNPSSDVERLHVKGTGADDTMVRIESTDDDADAGPVLEMYRNSASPAIGDHLGSIQFSGEKSDGTKYSVSKIFTEINSPDVADRMLFHVASSGGSGLNDIEYIRLDGGVRDVIINEFGNDIDLRVEGDTETNLIVTDASQDNVGVGTLPDSAVERLHVKGTGLTDMVVFEGTSEGSGASDGPDLILYNSATPTGANKFIGRLEYRGKNDAAATKAYGSIQTFIQDETAGTEDSLMLFKTMTAGSALEKLRFNLGGTELNSTGSESLDFDVKTSSSSTQQSFFKTYNSATVADRYTEVLRGTLTVSATPRTITEDYCYGSNVYMTSSASVITLPEGLPGMHLQVVNGGLTGLTMNPAAGEEINGSSSAYSLTDGYKITKVICVAAGEWVASD